MLRLVFVTLSGASGGLCSNVMQPRGNPNHGFPVEHDGAATYAATFVHDHEQPLLDGFPSHSCLHGLGDVLAPPAYHDVALLSSSSCPSSLSRTCSTDDTATSAEPYLAWCVRPATNTCADALPIQEAYCRPASILIEACRSEESEPPELCDLTPPCLACAPLGLASVADDLRHDTQPPSGEPIARRLSCPRLDTPASPSPPTAEGACVSRSDGAMLLLRPHCSTTLSDPPRAYTRQPPTLDPPTGDPWRPQQCGELRPALAERSSTLEIAGRPPTRGVRPGTRDPAVAGGDAVLIQLPPLRCFSAA